MESILQAQSVSRRFGAIRAVDAVSFSVPATQVVALLGPNGSGKSTLLRMMCGYLQPTSGDIHIAGHSITQAPSLAKSCLSYVPDECELYEHMPVQQFLRFMGELKGVDKAHLGRRINEVIDDLSLAAVVKQQIGALSRGFRQRVAIAQALLSGPSILLLDEPSNGLDLMQVQQWYELMATISQRCAIVFTSHVFDDVVKLADQVCLLSNGKLINQLSIDSSLSRENLEELFLAELAVSTN